MVVLAAREGSVNVVYARLSISIVVCDHVGDTTLDAGADLGMVGYEMTLLSQQLGEVLSPELIDRLKTTS